jgi:nitrate/nitrite-specific signal transduction histidine kinase
MTLRTQLWVTTLLPLVVCLILSCTVLLTSHRVHEAREAEQFARSVMQQMLELNRLTHAYLQRHGDPGRMRWQAKHQVFSKLLTAAKPLTMETRALIGKLRQNRQILSYLTMQHALPSSPSPSDLPEGSSSRREGANGQLHATLQAMLADAYQLTRHSYQSLAVMQQQMQRLTLGLSIAIFSIIAWVCWYVGGHLVAALAQLREGTQRTASESPSYCASIRTPGEIGQLVQALNQMTEWLQQSHITLQTEIAERQRAEEARRQREAELRLVIDNVPVIIAYCDRH